MSPARGNNFFTTIKPVFLAFKLCGLFPIKEWKADKAEFLRYVLVTIFAPSSVSEAKQRWSSDG
jgi:hypothetical protein